MRRSIDRVERLLVERLGVGGGGSDVGVTSSLVGTGGLLEGLGGGQVGAAGSVIRLGVVGDEVEGGFEEGEHCERWKLKLSVYNLWIF
jgi:hypothetical protein